MKDELIRIIEEKSEGFTPVRYLRFRVVNPTKREFNLKKEVKEQDIEVQLDESDIEWIEREVSKFLGSKPLKKITEKF